MDHAGELCTSAAFDVDDGTHCCACAWESAEESGDGVTDALSNQFAVAVVLGLGNVVGHYRGEQGVDGAETGECETGDESRGNDCTPVDVAERHGAVGEERHRQTRRYFTDDRYTAHIDEQRDYSHNDESHKS